jgi:hypothetical protein
LLFRYWARVNQSKTLYRVGYEGNFSNILNANNLHLEESQNKKFERFLTLLEGQQECRVIMPAMISVAFTIFKLANYIPKLITFYYAMNFAYEQDNNTFIKFLIALLLTVLFSFIIKGLEFFLTKLQKLLSSSIETQLAEAQQKLVALLKLKPREYEEEKTEKQCAYQPFKIFTFSESRHKASQNQTTHHQVLPQVPPPNRRPDRVESVKRKQKKPKAQDEASSSSSKANSPASSKLPKYYDSTEFGQIIYFNPKEVVIRNEGRGDPKMSAEKFSRKTYEVHKQTDKKYMKEWQDQYKLKISGRRERCYGHVEERTVNDEVKNVIVVHAFDKLHGRH